MWVVLHTGLTICMGKLVQMLNLMKKQPIQHKYKTRLDISVFQTKETQAYQGDWKRNAFFRNMILRS